MKIKDVCRGKGTATLIEENDKVLLVARCDCAPGTNGAQYQRAYHLVELTEDKAKDLLARYGKERSCQEGDYLVYPLHVVA